MANSLRDGEREGVAEGEAAAAYQFDCHKHMLTSTVCLTVSGTCCRPGGTFALFHVHNSDACTNDDFVNASSKSSYAMKMKLPKRESSWQRGRGKSAAVWRQESIAASNAFVLQRAELKNGLCVLCLLDLS